MAFIKPEEDKTAENVTAEPVTSTTPTISSASSSPGADATTATAAAPQKQGTGFSNLSRWLQANQGGAQNLGNQLASKVQSGVNEAQQVLTPAVDKINQQIQQGTNIFNPNAALGDTSNIKGYAGPQSFQETETAQQIEDRLRKANDLASAVGDISGRTELLKNLAPGTTQGGANLNQFLVQNTQPAWSQVANAADTAAGFGDVYQTAVSGIQNRINQARQTSEQAAQQAQGRQLSLQEQKYADERAAAQRAFEQQQAQIAAQQQQYLAQQQAQQAAAAAEQQKAMAAAQEYQKALELERKQATLQQQAEQAAAAAKADAAARAEAERQAKLQAAVLAELQRQAEAAAAAKVVPTVRENAPNVVNESRPVNPYVAPIKRAVDEIKKVAPKPAKPGPSSPGWGVPAYQSIAGYSGDTEYYGWFDQYGNQVAAPPAAPQTFWESTGGM